MLLISARVIITDANADGCLSRIPWPAIAVSMPVARRGGDQCAGLGCAEVQLLRGLARCIVQTLLIRSRPAGISATCSGGVCGTIPWPRLGTNGRFFIASRIPAACSRSSPSAGNQRNWIEIARRLAVNRTSCGCRQTDHKCRYWQADVSQRPRYLRTLGVSNRVQEQLLPCDGRSPAALAADSVMYSPCFVLP
jgi:hypothetical protein